MRRMSKKHSSLNQVNKKEIMFVDFFPKMHILFSHDRWPFKLFKHHNLENMDFGEIVSVTSHRQTIENRLMHLK